MKAWAFIQNPNWEDTKYRKTITSYFIGDIEDIYENVLNWQSYLYEKGLVSAQYLPRLSKPMDCLITNLILFVMRLYVTQWTPPYAGLLISALDQKMGHAMDVGVIISSYGTTPSINEQGS